jgi:hypothetical protein
MKITFIFASHLCLGLPSGHFPLEFASKTGSFYSVISNKEICPWIVGGVRKGFFVFPYEHHPFLYGKSRKVQFYLPCSRILLHHVTLGMRSWVRTHICLSQIIMQRVREMKSEFCGWNSVCNPQYLERQHGPITEQEFTFHTVVCTCDSCVMHTPSLT